MLSYCLKCNKNTENIDPKVSATSNDKTMILSKCQSVLHVVPKNQNLLKKTKSKKIITLSRY